MSPTAMAPMRLAVSVHSMSLEGVFPAENLTDPALPEPVAPL
jgi:hypothetical protein